MPKKLTQALVRELLDYDPETGFLVWKYRDRRFFSEDRIWKGWNTKHAGKAAFTATDTYGHRHGHLLGHLYSAHRLIFFRQTGRWPPVVDHEIVIGRTTAGRIYGQRLT